jgi:hypothetical protein
MDIILAALIASKPVLPTIDRESLELQARAEALRPVTAPPAQRPRTRRASSPGTLDLGSITTICRAAGNQADPAAFIAGLSGAYSLSAEERGSLRSSCAAYLDGRADARRAR